MHCPECDTVMYAYLRDTHFQKYTCKGQNCRIESITVEYRYNQ